MKNRLRLEGDINMALIKENEKLSLYRHAGDKGRGAIAPYLFIYGMGRL
jgi:hypothetical protein